MKRRFLVTGTAGFIGFHLARRLLDAGHGVVGIDALTPYYDVALKHARHDILKQAAGFHAIEAQLEEGAWRTELGAEPFDAVIHLAAQAGVRYSIDAPQTYVDANISGSFQVLEYARHCPPDHLMLASTSSVYGMSDQERFSERDETRRPVSFYAATKVGMEAMAHSYAHLYSIPTTAFRFFTVYGPWGRPDMALFKFTKAILEGRPIEVYGEGQQERDFTYVDDLVSAIAALIDVVPDRGQDRVHNRARVEGDTLSPVAPYRVVNIGGGRPVRLLDFIEELERALAASAEKIMTPMQVCDVRRTAASRALLDQLTGPAQFTPLDVGIGRFVAWYREYYGL